MLRTLVLQKRKSSPVPCDLKWHLSAQCSSNLACETTALSACQPDAAQVLPAAPQQSKLLSANSLKSYETKINWSYCENTRKDKTTKLPPDLSLLSNWKASACLITMLIYFFADVTLQNQQLGDIWLVPDGHFSRNAYKHAFVLSSGSIYIGLGDWIFFQGGKTLS